MQKSRIRTHRDAQAAWSKSHIRYLRQRRSKGASAARIARELGGGISRDAELGKIRRLDGIAGRPDRQRNEHSTGKGNRAASSRAIPDRLRAREPANREWPFPAWLVDAEIHADAPYVDDPGIDADIPAAQRRSFLDLDSQTCRWPVGDPGSRDFFFCGAPPLAGRPYCAGHCARAYRAQGDAIRAQGDATAARESRKGDEQ